MKILINRIICPLEDGCAIGKNHFVFCIDSITVHYQMAPPESIYIYSVITMESFLPNTVESAMGTNKERKI